MDERAKHVITGWKHLGTPSEKFEPKTIEVHCDILDKFPPEKQYVWWGKISKTGNLGIEKSDVTLINQQIASGAEVHLYMYCPENLQLHVGKIEEVSTSDRRGDPHTPKYYSYVPYSFPVWFKLSDIKKLDFQRFILSNILKEVDGTPFDAVSTGRYYPRFIYEDPPQYFFNYNLTARRKWFARGGIGALIPRCFKTGGLICTNPEAQLPESPQRVFIGMPFRPAFENMYKAAIVPALHSLGLTPWKANEEIQNIDLMCKICAGIQICSLAIIDISDWNPNVLFELGIIYGLGKTAFLIKQKDAKMPIDLRGMLYISYDDYDKLKQTLMSYISKVIERGY